MLPEVGRCATNCDNANFKILADRRTAQVKNPRLGFLGSVRVAGLLFRKLCIFIKNIHNNTSNNFNLSGSNELKISTV